ncbi:hypothetical protein Vadar_033461 [Vaccinium darrowii]|uniref:Uncharacterized protein n=1 Tax=Vaccinium darrowii TaxID=229202 RepID=A0ACB7Z8Q2_9ERIC|nr:hypothetical protein Vadar_033461 [Vaccinium darrowii]
MADRRSSKTYSTAAESFEDLPDECWEIIFGRLLQLHHSHLEPASLSCKRFLSITNNLRTHFEITVPTLIPLSRLFKRFPRLNSLHFRTFRRGNDLDRVIIDVATNSNLNLETLKFSGTQLPLEGFKLLGSRMKNLKVLTCGNLATLRDSDLVVIADSMPSLEDLDISFPVNDFGASAGNETLALHSSEKDVTDLGIEVLSSKLKGLRMIDLSGYLTAIK